MAERCRALVWGVWLFVTMSAEGPFTDPSSTLRALEFQWVAALQKADAHALELILAADYIETDETGGRTDRSSLLAALTTGDLTIQSISLGAMTIRVYRDAAVVIGSAEEKGTFRGHPLAPKFVFTDTFVRQGGAWRAVASHRSVGRAT